MIEPARRSRGFTEIALLLRCNSAGKSLASGDLRHCRQREKRLCFSDLYHRAVFYVWASGSKD